MAVTVATEGRVEPSPPEVALGDLYILSILPRHAADVIARAARLREVGAAERIVRRGSPCDSAFVLLRGTLAFGRYDDASSGFEAATYAWRGAMFGTHARRQGATHAFDVFALGEGAELLEIPGRTLARALELDATGGLAGLLNPAVRRLIATFEHEDVEPEAALAVAGCFSARRVGDGSIILATSSIVTEWCLVDAGAVRYGERSVGAGEDLGLDALLLRVPAPAPAIARGPTTVLAASYGALTRLFDQFPRLKLALHRRVARRNVVFERLPNVVHTDLDAVADDARPEEDAFELPDAPRAIPRWRPLPFARQEEHMDCGAACLRMIARYFGYELDYSALIRLAAVSRYGTSLLDLARAGEALGFITTGISADWDTFSAIELPAIAHLVDRHHFVVVWRVTAKSVTIGDPSLATRTMPRDQFERAWKGVLLLLKPTDQLSARAKELAPKPDQRGQRGSRLLPLVRPYRRTIVEIVVLSLILQALSFAFPIGSQIVVDRVLMRADAQLLDVLLAGLLGTSVAIATFSYARAYLVLETTTKIERDVIETLYRRIMGGVSGLFQRFTTSDVLNRFLEVSLIRSFIIDNAVTITIDLVMILGASVILAAYSPSLTWLVFALVPVQLAAASLVGRWIRDHTAAYLNYYDNYQTHLMDSFKAFEMVKSHGLEIPFTRTMQRMVAPTLEHSFRTLVYGATGGALSTALDLVGSALILWAGARRVLDGSMSIGTLMAFTMLARQVGAPVVRIATQWREFQRTRASLARVGALLSMESEEMQSTAVLELPPVTGDVRFHAVSFGYQGGREGAALRNVNLEIAAGEVVALVGPSGCGKSTLVRLLMRMHDPTEGSVSIDGINLRDVTPESVRRQIGLVTQDVQLISGTLFDNIQCGRAVTEEAIVRAAQLAGAYEFISALPYGFHTLVGERGLPLSGGQRQRIVIARALVTDPRILVFDEATAALDPLSEQSIHANLREIVKGRTTIIISHRIQTLRHADRIIVMNEGGVSQVGTHESLIAVGGKLYSALANATPNWKRSEVTDDAAA